MQTESDTADKGSKANNTIAVRFDPDTVKRIDDLAATASQANTFGATVTRSDIVRTFVLRAIKELDGATVATPPPAPKKKREPKKGPKK
jgi:hypothetical protein